MVRHAPIAIMAGSEEDARAVARMDDDVDSLYEAIVTYLGHLANRKLSGEQTSRVQDALYIANYIENMADVIEINMVTAGLHRAEMGVQISPETRELLGALAEKVQSEVALALECIETWDREKARAVIAHKPGVARLSAEVSRHLIARLGAAEPGRPEAYSVESELVESLKRIYYLAKRIAKVVAGVDDAETSEPQVKKDKKKKKEKKKD